ncbi:MAG: hypothetical protein IT204_02350 [Fimbriimonadaceae bacterium]|nr:hypothetical protein [Fimbriimonadaceae bacterium]
MTHADHLLEQAAHLARRQRGRPRQADLRRAVSAAYYALFHALIDASTRMALGSSPSRAPLRGVLARCFDHGEMARACKALAGGTLPSALQQVLPAGLPSPDLQRLGIAFGLLQRWRHTADYDLNQPLARAAVLSMIDLARTACAVAATLPTDDTSRLFLALLPLWGRLRP